MTFKSGFKKAAMAYVRFGISHEQIGFTDKTAKRESELWDALRRECDRATIMDVRAIVDYLAHTESHGWDE